ncbi:glutathione S-transferase family protein [Neptuniibacter halophilus]|uniref:glutathione S-transferase family protein n=1 Tax=Neptuniibacter halophilus TaxID=651666 RepID=UPI00257279EF|nr:glutathione S-transferase [Neptuniibacter halophilus]
MKLYDLEPSGNCYKVRLFAALAGIELETVAVDFLSGEHKQSPLIDLNPLGELPILQDGDLVLRDSQAILVYLARRYASPRWYGETPAEVAQIEQWLSTAANEIQHGPGAARLVDKFGYALDKPLALEKAARILQQVDTHLQRNDWLTLQRPTIADCAVMPYVALAHEGGIRLEDYPAILDWIGRIRALPGFQPMSGL